MRIDFRSIVTPTRFAKFIEDTSLLDPWLSASRIKAIRIWQLRFLKDETIRPLNIAGPGAGWIQNSWRLCVRLWDVSEKIVELLEAKLSPVEFMSKPSRCRIRKSRPAKT